MNKQLGRYELRRAIGRGAAGTVWEAWDTTLTRRVAVKVVRPGEKDDYELDDMLTRFRQEAQVASCLSHAGVVQVYDYGEVAGEAYIVMEFVEGETLKALLDRGERLKLPRVAEIINGVLLALEQCHRQGVVHRDIKPANIMLPSGGGVKLADFGIARIENSELTMIGTVMGTPAYMSPEQFAARPIDLHTDIWSCGILLYEMLTGTRPFTGNTSTVIGQSVANDPFEPPSRRVPGLPAALDQVVQRALRKVPSERFGSAQDFARAIAAAMPTGPAPQAGKGEGSGRKLVIAGAIAAIILLAGGAGAWWWLGAQKPQPAPAVAPAVPVLLSPPAPLAPPPVPTPARPPIVAPTLSPSAPPAARPAAPPVAPMVALPTPSVPAQVAALPCSTVTAQTGGPQGGTSLRGIIGAGAPRAALDAIIAKLPPSTIDDAVQTFPATDLSCRLAVLVRANAGAIGARLSTVDGRVRLVDGEEIRLELAMPDFDGEVHLEDLDSDGNISNVMEGNFGAPLRQRAGTLVGLGSNGDSLIGKVAAPYGTDLLVAIVSSEKLFSGPRPPQESGAQFITDLNTAMSALRRRGGQVAADAFVLTTAPR